MTSRAAFAGGPFVEFLAKMTESVMGDTPGFNPVASQNANNYAQEACATFMPSTHRNSRPKGRGESVRCTKCQKPQHQHWLRQALYGQR
jgi:hypothetical protein